MKVRGLLLAILTATSLSLMACNPHDIGQGGRITVERAEAKNCNFEDNLDLTADQFISKCCKGSIRRAFPGDYYNKTLKEISNDNSKDGKKANKLLCQERFRK